MRGALRHYIDKLAGVVESVSSKIISGRSCIEAKSFPTDPAHYSESISTTRRRLPLSLDDAAIIDDGRTVFLTFETIIACKVWTELSKQSIRSDVCLSSLTTNITTSKSD